MADLTPVPPLALDVFWPTPIDDDDLDALIDDFDSLLVDDDGTTVVILGV